MTTTTESHPNITETIWKSLDKELSKKEVARGVTQALTRMFVENPSIMQGLWDTIKDVFPKEKNLTTQEDFTDYLRDSLQSGNNALPDEEWGTLTECFRRFCYYEIFTAMAYHGICIDDYVDDTTWTPFRTLVCNRISSYKQLMQSPASVDKNQLLPPSLLISCSPSEEDIPVVDRMVIASYLSLPSSVFEVYFKGELSGNWNR